MTEHEQKVWSAIKLHVGLKFAISRKALEIETDLHERHVRDCIASLKQNHNKLICASPSGGYFIPESIEEIRMCRNIEMSREVHVRENRQFYDKAINAISDAQQQLFPEVAHA